MLDSPYLHNVMSCACWINLTGGVYQYLDRSEITNSYGLSPSTINSDHNFYIFRDGASNNNGGVSQYGSYGRSSPGIGNNIRFSYAFFTNSTEEVDYDSPNIIYSYGSFYQKNLKVRSPYVSTFSSDAWHMYPTGSIDYHNSVWSDSDGRKYFITLRLPTQLETVYFMLKLMEVVI